MLQTDFGLAEGAVAEMKGVAFSVDPSLRVVDLTHLIPPYDIWEAAIRLQQTAAYWPAGTVFVSIVDPGVGTERKAVVMRTRTGQYFVGPDNGTFTFVARAFGVEAVREIDEQVNRLAGSDRSHTFHGRDIFAYTGARLAAGVIDFEGVGPDRGPIVVSLPHAEAAWNGRTLSGTVMTVDQPFGNLWSNIGSDLIDQAGIKAGDSLDITIRQGTAVRYRGRAPWSRSFGDVGRGRPLVYLNSTRSSPPSSAPPTVAHRGTEPATFPAPGSRDALCSLIINQASFAQRFHVGRGPDWRIEVAPTARGR